MNVPYWTDKELLLLMSLSFIVGLLLSWLIRTLKSFK